MEPIYSAIDPAWILSGGAVIAAIIAGGFGVMIAKINHVKHLTNGSATAMLKHNMELHEKITRLERIITRQDEEARKQ